jgi:uncharacterized protein YceH (UPF0502 family)
MSSTAAERTWVPLSPRERRVLGVLVEKAKTTPENYPLSVAAIVAGCNQKSNRDPVTNYDADDVEDTLQDLRLKGAAVMVEAGGRVARWRHRLYEWLKVEKVELAVLAELLLRGPQTEGELRGRASRMEPLTDLAALQAVLEALAGRDLVVYLTPPGQKRGVVVAHGLYPPAEAEQVRQAFARHAAAADEGDNFLRPGAQGGPVPAGSRASAEELAALRSELEELRGTVAALAAEVRALKAELGS